MATILHTNLTGAELHEPKGAAAATANQVYVADGAASGAWFTLVPVGVVFDYCGSTEPTGFLFANGQTIGNGSSNATARANADTELLFTLLWNSSGNTELPILDSAGAASTRGASAAADFAANKAIPLPDYCGRTSVGQDDMDGITSKDRLTGGSGSVDGDTLFATGGGETFTVAQANLPSVNFSHSLTAASHTHSASLSVSVSTSIPGFNSGTHTSGTGIFQTSGGSQNTSVAANGSGTASGTTAASGALAVSGTVSSGGSGTALSKVQHCIVVNKIIFYGA